MKFVVRNCGTSLRVPLIVSVAGWTMHKYPILTERIILHIIYYNYENIGLLLKCIDNSVGYIFY